jgi:hypothetical protein
MKPRLEPLGNTSGRVRIELANLPMYPQTELDSGSQNQVRRDCLGVSVPIPDCHVLDYRTTFVSVLS